MCYKAGQIYLPPTNRLRSLLHPARMAFQERTFETAVKLAVKHVLPLHRECVCGSQREFDLAILPAWANARKSRDGDGDKRCLSPLSPSIFDCFRKRP